MIIHDFNINEIIIIFQIKIMEGDNQLMYAENLLEKKNLIIE